MTEIQKIFFSSLYPKMIDVFPEPEPSSKLLPEWYKDQPAYVTDGAGDILGTTIKRCQAIFDIVTNGYILKCPTDIFVDTTENNKIFEVVDKNLDLKTAPLIGHHAKEQVSHYPLNKNFFTDHIFRINMVWIVKTEPGYSSLFFEPQHLDYCPLHAISAIIDTDSFYSDGQFSFLVDKNFKGIIKKGTPLVKILPFKRDDWEHVINKNTNFTELNEQRKAVRMVFQGGYKNKFWKKKNYK